MIPLKFITFWFPFLLQTPAILSDYLQIRPSSTGSFNFGLILTSVANSMIWLRMLAMKSFSGNHSFPFLEYLL
jgi:hypothetical protein